MKKKYTFNLFWILILLFISSCKNKGKSPHENDAILNADTLSKDYLSLIISMDTLSLSSSEYKEVLNKEYKLLVNSTDKLNNPFYYYFRARKFISEKQRDSGLVAFESMKGKVNEHEVELLKTYEILNLKTKNKTVDAVLTQQIISALQKAEHLHSRITYRFYDLLAKVYYQNNNNKNALLYVERYFKSHPYKSHPVIEQRYYDISFLLASQMGDYQKMISYNSKARVIAKRIGDSLAIARTYDNEAQIHVKNRQMKKAVDASKAYVNYLKKINNINDIAYNNLASSFVRNHQLDSAIHYYLRAITLAQKNSNGRQEAIYFSGLMEAYRLKGSYKKALDAADISYTMYLKNIKEIEAVKIAELHEKYESEKKDRNIVTLNSRNDLNEKIINQQRWTIALSLFIFVGVLSFFYIIYRQQRLKEKNKLLQSENKRLNIEQKLLQAQLNPHFIFNSIANLQGLIASGDTSESVRYLSSFSKLLRSVLEQSRKDFIGLDEEIDSLNNYLQLQQMRFVDLFDYRIKVDENVNLENIMIPPMLLQPFIENAIEHGFRNLSYKGDLIVDFKIDNNQLIIIVEDNGSGFTVKDGAEATKISLAQIILKERLDVLFKARGKEAKFEVLDKKNNGDKGVNVQIVIPVVND